MFFLQVEVYSPSSFEAGELAHQTVLRGEWANSMGSRAYPLVSGTRIISLPHGITAARFTLGAQEPFAPAFFVPWGRSIKRGLGGSARGRGVRDPSASIAGRKASEADGESASTVGRLPLLEGEMVTRSVVMAGSRATCCLP